MKKIILALSFLLIGQGHSQTVPKKQIMENANQSLNAQQQSIVSISALTATGDAKHLEMELNAGLDAGLTINEIKEALVQLYAYCGFPRSLNGLNALMRAVEERKTKGKQDVTGRDASPVTDSLDKYERGRKTLETLTKTAQAKPAPGFGEFAPRIDAFLKEHLFADIFDSDVLSYAQRELVTISALAAMTGVESQLQSHVGIGLNTGLTESQLKQAFSLLETHVGKRQAKIANDVLSKVVASRQ